MHFGMVCHDELVKGERRACVYGKCMCRTAAHGARLRRTFEPSHPFEGCVVAGRRAICLTPSGKHDCELTV